MGVWSSVTGALDHAAGSVDESVGRQFDGQVGGGFGDGTTSGNPVSTDTDGDGTPDQFHNRWLRGETARKLYDTVSDYQGTLNGRRDTVDLLGPGAWGSEGSVADTVTRSPGEDPSDRSRAENAIWWLVDHPTVLVGGLITLYVLPAIGDLASAAGGES